MDKDGFRKYLKKRGKKAHVIDELVFSIEKFESYLLEQGVRDLQSAIPEDIRTFVDCLEKTKKGTGRKVVRGIALYYAMTGNDSMKSTANGIRDAAIAETRKVFLLREFRGMNENFIEILESTGIRNILQMIEAGKTPALRLELSRKTGIPLDVILEYVKLSDLSRLEGLKGVRARLYYDAGVDLLDKLAAWDPEELRQMLMDYVDRTQFDGIVPLPKEVLSTIKAANEIERLVEYE
jgi:hypothetical protein